MEVNIKNLKETLWELIIKLIPYVLHVPMCEMYVYKYLQGGKEPTC